MGLDIVAYSKLRESEYEDTIHVNRDAFKMNEDLNEGYYEHTDNFHFRAGSYSGYNHWRDTLCRAIHGVPAEVLWSRTKTYEGKDFFELINFSDCEGQFGPKISEKLYQDFANEENKKKLKNYLSENKIMDDYFYEANYDDFMKAFNLSRQEGLLVFC